jgi:hypothetical protein
MPGSVNSALIPGNTTAASANNPFSRPLNRLPNNTHSENRRPPSNGPPNISINRGPLAIDGVTDRPMQSSMAAHINQAGHTRKLVGDSVETETFFMMILS